MPDFTKGKWFVENEFDIKSDISENAYVAQLYLTHSDREIHANGRLLAAAPELYYELRELLGYLYNIQSEGYTPETQKDINRVEALLARIDGTKEN